MTSNVKLDNSNNDSVWILSGYKAMFGLRHHIC